MQKQPLKCRLGVVGMAYGGYQLGEELGPAKVEEIIKRLDTNFFEYVARKQIVMSQQESRLVGEQFAKQSVDAILVILTTFVPDYFVLDLVTVCDVPVFIWAVEREMKCLALVAGPLITATLYNFHKPVALYAGDTDDGVIPEKLKLFTRAALLKRILRTSRIGWCGGACPIMANMSADPDSLRRLLGVSVEILPIEELYNATAKISDADAKNTWEEIRKRVGWAKVQEADGIESARYYLGARHLVEKHNLSALSINCFPHLKSKICLAVACLNDDGVAAACEGDLHSTLLMHMLGSISGSTAFNGDWLRIYPDKNEILFSHCGAGAFSLAECSADITLRSSMETCDGVAVCYATAIKGTVTMMNLMNGHDGLRLAVIVGEACKTALEYEGTPLLMRISADVRNVLQRIVDVGAGHHWNGAKGKYDDEFALLCKWCGLIYNRID